MAKLALYDPPGGLADLDQAGRQQWNSYISDSIDQAITGRPDHTSDSPRGQFFNLTEKETAADAQIATVTWTAFPNQVKVSSVSDHQRWQRADSSRDLQDEYCEWSVKRSAAGKITAVTFTCEGPEYWTTLAESQPKIAVKLYQQYVDPRVSAADLFDSAGKYIPRNRWNSTTTNGAMHLVQAANTLGAEIELAAAATIVREIGGVELTGEQELIKCSQYGVATRNSDPHIGGSVNGLARRKADIALTNPVGLYLDDVSTAGWSSPDGSDPKLYWSYVRGNQGTPVRAVYEVPANKGFVVGDIQINGQTIDFAAQIADFITIKLSAVACRLGQSTAAPMTACVGSAAHFAPLLRSVR